MIATKDKDIVIVQCKYWSHLKTIHEKAIDQLAGTIQSFKADHHGYKVRGIFTTHTRISDTARIHAENNQIEVIEEDSIKSFPMVKCKISPKGEKIYHIPGSGDMNYDRIRIEKSKGDMYVSSIEEAVEKGFRWAKKPRWAWRS